MRIFFKIYSFNQRMKQDAALPSSADTCMLQTIRFRYIIRKVLILSRLFYLLPEELPIGDSAKKRTHRRRLHAAYQDAIQVYSKKRPGIYQRAHAALGSFE